jgi:CheY-like chemotaxis protein
MRAHLGRVPPVAGDAAELREALTNLILNAVDAMPSGGVLTLATAVVPDGVELVVGDTGIGIAESVRGRIFDPFFTTKGPRGTGLGLSITYGILSRHGVTIGVASEEGRGTTFRLLFSPREATGAAAAAEVVAAGTPPAPLTCLVVDDNAAVGAVVVDMIRASGHRAVLCGDGEAAIARVRAQPLDVVFTDLAMPGLTGWDVARAIRQEAPDLPVYVVTGFGVELADAKRHQHGVTGVLAKPLRVEDLLAILAHVQSGRPHPP